MAKRSPGFKFNVGGGEPLEVGGWAALEGLTAEHEQDKAFEAQLEHASMYRMAFTSEAGRYVLQDLMDGYLRQRIVNPEQTERHDAVRQGQADVVMRILKLIEFANTGGGRPTGGKPQED